MLADSVEASVRSLASRDEAAIRVMVSRIIEERIGDDQFDECDLTLRDIERIREAFVEQLLGHVPPADRVPPEQGGRDRVEAGRRRSSRRATVSVVRSLYLRPWRIDVEWRDGVPRLLPVDGAGAGGGRRARRRRCAAARPRSA